MNMRFLLWLLMPHNASIRRRYFSAMTELDLINWDPYATVQRAEEISHVLSRQDEIAHTTRLIQKIWRQGVPLGVRWKYRMALLCDDRCTITQIEKRYGTRSC